MKHKITLSIALVLSIMSVLLMSSDSSVEAQNQIRVVGDTGFIAAVLDQDLNSFRVTVNTGAGNDAVAVRFRRIDYTQIASMDVRAKQRLCYRTCLVDLMLCEFCPAPRHFHRSAFLGEINDLLFETRKSNDAFS